MTFPLIPEFLILNIPKGISLLILLGLVIAGYSEKRKGHIGRVAIFLNAILLWQIFYNSFGGLPEILKWYLNVGTIIGLVALFTYVFRKSLPTEFYTFSYLFYGSLSVLVAIFASIYFGISLF